VALLFIPLDEAQREACSSGKRQNPLLLGQFVRGTVFASGTRINHR
jgi:hypothetical protein